MEKELDHEIIKNTQKSLGKFVKRPQLTDKLLKKPPFRFLHDIVTTVIKTTGFFKGLFEEDELISDNVKDRDSKIQFLTKVIAILSLVSEKQLSVKPSKIIAGQEPEKTNELLQTLGNVLERKLTSEDAVKTYLASQKKLQPSSAKDEQKLKTKKITDDKLSLKTVDKTIKKEGSEKPLKQSDSTKKHASLNKIKVENEKKKESPPKKVIHEIKVSEVAPTLKHIDTIDHRSTDEIYNSLNEETKNYDKTIITDELKSSATILKEDVNDSLSSSHLFTNNDLNNSAQFKDQDTKQTEDNSKESVVNKKSYSENIIDNTNTSNNKNENLNDLDQGSSSSKKEAETTVNTPKQELSAVTKVVRPLSVRPSSSRPGAPRLRDKHEVIIPPNDSLLVTKVNIISDKTINEEEEDSGILIQEGVNSNQTSVDVNQHGHLVKQILDSQKEFSQNNDIEWNINIQKSKEASNQEIDLIRFNIQALSRVANPLGKLLDHIQEDVEVMRQEFNQWTKFYENASKELFKQKLMNEDSLAPFLAKLRKLDTDIKDKQEKITDIQITLHKNNLRIDKLITTGNVQE